MKWLKAVSFLAAGLQKFPTSPEAISPCREVIFAAPRSDPETNAS
jgi:hypothetical protein